MKIKQINITNILSIESASVSFDDDGLMLVKGWDYDTNRSNGAGKTSIFNALSFALFDKLPRKITASEILRRGCKQGTVEVTIEVNSNRYTVSRSRPKGVLFRENGNELTITQEEFESKIGLNYQQFMMIVYCSQSNSIRFLAANDADKKKFMLQLLNIDSFATAKKRADEVIKQLDAKLVLFNSQLSNIQSKIEAYSESLCDENDLIFQLNELKEKSKPLHDTLLKYAGVAKPDLTKFQSLEDDVTNKRLLLSKIKAQKDILNQEYNKLALNIKPFSGSSSCYACGSKLDNNHAKANHEKEIDQIKEKIKDIKKQIDSCEEKIKKDASYQDLLKKIKEKKKNESLEYESAQSMSIDLKSKIQLNEQKQETINSKLKNNQTLKDKICALKQENDNIIKNIDDLKQKIDIHKTISNIYSSTGAQAYVLDSVIDLFNESVSKYVQKMWDFASYQLIPYKEKEDGELSTKFSEKFTINGKDVSIGSLSGGEYRALSLCIDLALIEVLEVKNGSSISPIIFDEPFDGLDIDGRELVVDMLKLMANDKQIVVIDHMAELKSMFSKTLTVEKRSGISTVNIDT
jgi:DNA repair exonuclease SbcCD ATPase subunit